MNANFQTLDKALGQNTAVGLTNVNVTLSAAQYANLFINFTGTLTGSVSVQFPNLQRIWIVRNGCTNNTTFSVNTVVNVAGRQPCLPPNETVMIISDGTNLDILGLGRVGTYLDIGATSVPLWITASTPAPYLNCDGTSFSSATYPALRDYLGTTTLPDTRGRSRFSLNQGTGRLTGASSTFGLGGESSSFLSGGGSQTIGQTNIPNYALTVTDPGHLHAFSNALSITGTTGTFAAGTDATLSVFAGTLSNTNSATTGITVNSGGSGTGFAPPAYVGGLTLIRAG